MLQNLQFKVWQTQFGRIQKMDLRVTKTVFTSKCLRQVEAWLGFRLDLLALATFCVLNRADVLSNKI